MVDRACGRRVLDAVVPPGFKIATFVILAVLSGLMASWLGLFEAAHHDGE